MTMQRRRARLALLGVGLIAPLIILVLAAVIMAAWLPQQPDPAAIHWGSGGPDGFGPPWANLAVTTGVGAGIVLLFFGISWASMRMPRPGDATTTRQPRAPESSATARLLAAVALGVAVMVSFLGLATMGSQRGLADAHAAPDVGWAVLIGFGLLAAFTAIGWFCQPAPPEPVPHTGPGARPLPVTDGGRAAWFGTATLSRSGLIVLSALLMLALATGVVLLAVGESAGWIPMGVALLLIVAVLMTSVFRVSAGTAGLTVRSAFGWPRVTVPAGEIASVRAVFVNPFAEFGGWGMRWSTDGRFGIVLRTGEGIEVQRTRGRTLVLTVDDAEAAASVLSLAASAR